MVVERRMRTLRLLKKIDKNQVYCKKIGVEDVSMFRGKTIEKKQYDSSDKKGKEKKSLA